MWGYFPVSLAGHPFSPGRLAVRLSGDGNPCAALLTGRWPAPSQWLSGPSWWGTGLVSQQEAVALNWFKKQRKKITIFMCLLSGFWRPWQSSLHFNKCFYDTIPRFFFCGYYYCNFCTVLGSELKTSPLSYPCSPCSIKLPSKGRVDRWVNASQRLLCGTVHHWEYLFICHFVQYWTALKSEFHYSNQVDWLAGICFLCVRWEWL